MSNKVHNEVKEIDVKCNICHKTERVRLDVIGDKISLELFESDVRRHFECAKCLGNSEDANKIKTYKRGYLDGE